MDVLIDFIAGIGEALIGLVDFIVSMVMDLVYIVQLIGTVLFQIPALFSWLPAEISVIIVLGITVAAVYKIAGRD